MRACDDEQGSSSPVRHECNEQGHGARAQGSSPALCRGPRAMDEWAWAKARHGSRVWAASELRHNAHCLAQERAASRAASASSRATSAAPSVDRAQLLAHSERWLACIKRWSARSKRWRARTASDGSRASSAGARAASTTCAMACDGKMQQLCDERMGCAHMASNGCVRTVHGRATRRVFALRLDRFECLI